MNKLFIQNKFSSHRFIYQQEVLGNVETASQAKTEPVQSLEDFIKQQSQEINDQIKGIPVPPRIRDLCHCQVGDLIAQNCTGTGYEKSQGDMQRKLEKELNNGESLTPQSPQELEAEREVTQAELVEYLEHVQETIEKQAIAARQQTGGDAEKLAHVRRIESRGKLIGGIADSINTYGIAWEQTVPFGGNEALVAQAESTEGIVEGAEATNLVGLDTVNIPWCGAYVKAMIEKSGKTLPDGPNWNVAETYVKQPSAAGQHVAIYIGNGLMIGGNQSQAVTKCPIPSNYRFNTVENLMNGVHADLASTSEPQPGDIIVTSRTAGNSDPNATGPQ